jgi:hypothetical protein
MRNGTLHVVRIASPLVCRGLVVLAAQTGLGGNSLIHIEFRRTARWWARAHTPHLPVM